MTKSRVNADNVTADIAGITAGTGITGGGTSGTVTITNDMATTIAAKGDILAGTANDAYSALTVGTNGQVLTAASGEATGLQWATPASGGANWSLLNSGGTALTGATTITISGISSKDKIMALVTGGSAGLASVITFRLNGDTASNYNGFGALIFSRNDYNKDQFSSFNNTGTSSINFANQANNVADTFAGAITFTGCNSAGVKAFVVTGAGNNANGNLGAAYIGQGYWDNSATVTSISILSSVGNFDAGTIYIYTSA